MRVMSLFSGYGGLDHGLLSVVEGEVVAVADVDHGATLGAQPHIRHERTLGLLGVLLLSPSPARVVSVGMLAVGTVLALVVGAGMARQADQRER